ncbi:hypothetical protein CLAFUW4_14810 [Fulvia fulva]|nr:hypothetical protein CLAFUR0_14802 [Fulvia fulva]WPV23016.1 hypothetical protein CLAFUW4_14810 [Fulvia fulva]WPV37959.1 hypothetical protein CLAFUW7_14811 [Fulvia fulva]
MRNDRAGQGDKEEGSEAEDSGMNHSKEVEDDEPEGNIEAEDTSIDNDEDANGDDGPNAELLSSLTPNNLKGVTSARYIPSPIYTDEAGNLEKDEGDEYDITRIINENAHEFEVA